MLIRPVVDTLLLPEGYWLSDEDVDLSSDEDEDDAMNSELVTVTVETVRTSVLDVNGVIDVLVGVIELRLPRTDVSAMSRLLKLYQTNVSKNWAGLHSRVLRPVEEDD